MSKSKAAELKTLKQKYKFITAYNLPNSTLTSASNEAQALPQQMRRWRQSDPEFNHIIVAITALKALIRAGVSEGDDYQKVLALVRTYVHELGSTIHAARKQLTEPVK